MHPTPYVSVIIPVYNDAARLTQCLQALEQQTYPPDCYEVIVVDNDSDDDIATAVAPFGQVVLAHELRPGSYVARNRGIALAQGDLLAFTDADCIPAGDWLERGVARWLATPNCGMVAGQIDFFYRNPACPTAVELYDRIKLGLEQQKFLEDSHYGATANLFTSKAVMEVVGPFNASLKSSGDREWGQRVFAAGYRQVYAEEVCIAHPARYSWSQLRAKVTRLIGGHQDMKRQDGQALGTLMLGAIAASIKDLLPPFRMYFYIWSYDSLTGNKQRLQFVVAMLFVRYVRAWERLRLLVGGSSTRG